MYGITVLLLTVWYTATFAGISVLYRGGGTVFIGAGCDQFARRYSAYSHVFVGAFTGFAATADNFCSFDSVNFFHL